MDLTEGCLSSQDACIENCTTKFLKHSERVGARFAEENGESILEGQVHRLLLTCHCPTSARLMGNQQQ